MVHLVGIAEQTAVTRTTARFPFRQVFASVRIKMTNLQRLSSDLRNGSRLIEQPYPDAVASLSCFPEQNAPLILLADPTHSDLLLLHLEQDLHAALQCKTNAGKELFLLRRI